MSILPSKSVLYICAHGITFTSSLKVSYFNRNCYLFHVAPYSAFTTVSHVA